VRVSYLYCPTAATLRYIMNPIQSNLLMAVLCW
jgi:hypothetical protein